MNYISVCSGVDAATIAWRLLGWRPLLFSEIASFPRAVLQYHYPHVPLFADFTKITNIDVQEKTGESNIDVLIGGTPCQDFSIAGLRKGLGGENGNLALGFILLTQRLRPEWVVWENVLGVLSSYDHQSPEPIPPPPPLDVELDGQEMDTVQEYEAEENHAFECFCAGLAEIGYSFAYRTFDAQYFGLAQRRRRVFVVGHSSGEWNYPAAVLFERESLRRNSPPSRKNGAKVAGTVGKCSYGGGEGGRLSGNHFVADTAATLGANYGTKWGSNQDIKEGMSNYPATGYDIMAMNSGKDFKARDKTYREIQTLTTNGNQSGNQGGTYVVAPLTTKPYADNKAQESKLIVMASGQANAEICDDLSPTLNLNRDGAPIINGVRRLTPIECERLQGFPDNFTQISYRGKPSEKCPDGPRYEALGNSMPVPVIKWIGERIEMVNELIP